MENNELLLAVKGLLEENNEVTFKRMDKMFEENNEVIFKRFDQLDERMDNLETNVSALDVKIDNTKDEIISYIKQNNFAIADIVTESAEKITITIKQNNIAIAEIVTESAEKTEEIIILSVKQNIDDLQNVTAKNCYDITELREKAK